MSLEEPPSTTLHWLVGWKPGSTVTLYPENVRDPAPVAQGVADTTGMVVVTVPLYMPLVAVGERLDGKPGRVQTQANAWRTLMPYAVLGSSPPPVNWPSVPPESAP